MTPIPHELSTQEAAKLLNVSEPYLIDLLKERKIPCQKIGISWQILAQDMLAYKMSEDQARFKILAELTAESQKLGLYEKIDMNK